MAIYKIGDMSPEIHVSAFNASEASVAADVVIGEDSSVWYGAVVRGDEGKITIGKRTNVQDNATVHSGAGYTCTIGDNVTIGHNAVVHGCTVEDNCIIGMGAVILNGATIGEGCVIGAGSLVTERSVIPPNSVAMGSPAKVRRTTEEKDRDWISKNAQDYVNLKNLHKNAEKIGAIGAHQM